MWEIREKENRNVAIQKGEIVDVSYNVPKKRPVRKDRKFEKRQQTSEENANTSGNSKNEPIPVMDKSSVTEQNSSDIASAM